MRSREQWIWLDDKKYPNNQTTRCSTFVEPGEENYEKNYTVAEFRREYSFDKKVKELKLRFSGDTAFVLYMNGDIVSAGPCLVGGDYCANDKVRPQYYSTSVTLNPNTEKLEFFATVKMFPVLMFEYSHGHGGFSLFGEVRFEDGTMDYIITDESWMCRYCGAHVDYGTYDARIAPDPYYNSKRVTNIWHTEDSPLPPLTEEEISPIGGGVITLESKETKSLTLEFDKIYTALTKVEIEAEGECKLHLNSFEITDDGCNEYFHFVGNDSYRGFRTLSVGGYRVKAENLSDKPVTIRVSIIATSYPIKSTAMTKTSDGNLDLVLDVCRHTLKYCRHYIHLDSPRHCEPLACTGDYYIETLMTAFSYGDLSLSAFDLRRAAELLRYQYGDMFHTSYSLIWVQMLWDVYRLTGEEALLSDCKEALVMLLNRFRGYVGETGLIETPKDFMFIDWIYIDGISMHHPPKALGQTCLCAYYYGALITAEKIFRLLGEDAMADIAERDAASLKTAINKWLYDEERGLYFEGLNTKTPDELIHNFMPQNVEKRYYMSHSNILCSCFGICEGERAKRILRRIVSDESIGRCQPYFTHFLFEAIYRNGLRDELTIPVMRQWIEPIRECAKGLPEGFIKPEPTYHFDHSHAWGGTPLYSLPKALTGVEVTEPGYRAVTLSPSLLGLEWASVEIPTPYGNITVKQKAGEEPRVEAPAEIKVTIV